MRNFRLDLIDGDPSRRRQRAESGTERYEFLNPYFNVS
jgi:hypothetical protein